MATQLKRSAKSSKPSKSATVNKLLSRGSGATIAEIVKATGWKEHSSRAFLAGVRKKAKLLKEQRADGKTAYRIEPLPAGDSVAAGAKTEAAELESAQ